MPSKKYYVPKGKANESTSPFSCVRLKRIYGTGRTAVGDYPKCIKVQQKGKNAGNNTAWITLGCFDTENEAVDVLVDVSEMIRFIWMTKEF